MKSTTEASPQAPVAPLDDGELRRLVLSPYNNAIYRRSRDAQVRNGPNAGDRETDEQEKRSDETTKQTWMWDGVPGWIATHPSAPLVTGIWAVCLVHRTENRFHPTAAPPTAARTIPGEDAVSPLNPPT